MEKVEILTVIVAVAVFLLLHRASKVSPPNVRTDKKAALSSHYGPNIKKEDTRKTKEETGEGLAELVGASTGNRPNGKENFA